MLHDPAFAWTALLVLGSLHGVNPAMGWLFAVSLGLQERSGRAVWRAIGPLAVGHAAAVVAAAAVTVVLGRVVPLGVVEWIVGVLLVVVGIGQLVRHRHPRMGGMRVGARELAVWSFLMASAHGAGLMALPFFPSGESVDPARALTGHGSHQMASLATGVGSEWATALIGSAVHTAGYLVVTGLVAWMVYRWVGVRLLRRAWINLNVMWAGALIATGILTLVL